MAAEKPKLGEFVACFAANNRVFKSERYSPGPAAADDAPARNVTSTSSPEHSLLATNDVQHDSGPETPDDGVEDELLVDTTKSAEDDGAAGLVMTSDSSSSSSSPDEDEFPRFHFSKNKMRRMNGVAPDGEEKKWDCKTFNEEERRGSAVVKDGDSGRHQTAASFLQQWSNHLNCVGAAAGHHRPVGYPFVGAGYLPFQWPFQLPFTLGMLPFPQFPAAAPWPSTVSNHHRHQQQQQRDEHATNNGVSIDYR
jgi:hypothetical protein